MHLESDLLFALLAAHHGFASRESVLQSVFAWLGDEKTPLPDRVATAAILTKRRRKALEALVDVALETSAGDAARALSAAPVDAELARALVELRLPPHLDAAVQEAGRRAHAGQGGSDGTRYRLGSEIGRGGLGRVVEATDGRLHRDVAVKLVLADMPDTMAERFTREARITAKLDHPHVVPVHDFGTLDNGGQRQLFLCMKRIRGRDLGSLIDAISKGEETGTRTSSRARLLSVFQDICLGVAYAHSKGIIHRDLKPSNVMIGDFGETLIVDWGLAKVLGEAEPADVSRALTRITTTAKGKPVSAGDKTVVPSRSKRPVSSTLTMEGDVIGTPAYMPPEQAEGRIHEMDARSDLWSLGAILYEILTLKPPFDGASVDEVIERVKTGRFPPASERVRRREHPFLAPVPPELDAIVAKAMAFRREDRYASALDLHHDVQLFLEGVKERERLEREAREMTALGDRERARYVRLRGEVDSAALRVAEMTRALRGERPLSEKRPLWEAEAAVKKLEIERIDAFSRANGAYGQALALRPGLEEALHGKCDLFLERYLDAEARRDRNEMLFQWNVLAQYDRAGTYRRRLEAPGTLSLRTFAWECDCLAPVKAKTWRVEFADECGVPWRDGRARPDLPPTDDDVPVPRATVRPASARWGHRPGCRRREVVGIGVAVARYEERDKRFVPGPDTLIGRTPLADVSLPRGSYRCVLTPPPGSGLAPVVLPVRIDRDGRWSQDVNLYASDEVPPGMIYVPGGPFFLADDHNTPSSSEDFFIGRFSVACAEYLEFLNGIGLAEARARQPRGSDRPYWVETKSKTARFRLPTRKEDPQIAWDPDLPVFSVNWHDANAYCAWRSARERRLYALPHAHEFMKAARGVDARRFPFGDEWDDAFSDASKAAVRTGPVSVHAYPLDESPYGVRGMAGGVQCLCANPPLGNPKARVNYGGGWSLTPSGIAHGAGSLPSMRRWFLGFRVVARPMA